MNRKILSLCQTGKYDTDKFFFGSHLGQKSQPSRHTYVEMVYDDIFERIKESAKNVLEVGSYSGGSHLLWRDYFTNAEIVAMDINPVPALDNQERITLHVGDAYCENSLSLYPDNYFDLMIDDGPHTYESMVYFLSQYHSKLKDGGIMIVEDIQSIEWVKPLISLLPERLIKYTKVYDLRTNINRSDDILIVVNTGV